MEAAIHTKSSIEVGKIPIPEGEDWKNEEPARRAEAAKVGNEDEDEDEEVVASAILSYCDAPSPPTIAKQLLTLSGNRSDKIRAAAITVLAFQTEALAANDFRRILRDDSRYVRMAGLFALSRSPGTCPMLTDEVIALFADPDLDVRCCAIKLACKIKSGAYIKPLISGLEEDAIHERVSTFSARCNALEAITGIHFDPEPEWREEQGIYSDRSTRGRVHIALKWMQWDRSLSSFN